MAIEEGKKAPAFTLAGPGRQEGLARGLRREDRGPLLLPEGRHARLHQGGLRLPRPLGELSEAAASVVLGVSADGAESHTKFIAKYKLPFPLLSDPDRKVMAKYGAWGEKIMYGKKTIGVIRSTVVIGPDGVVRKHWKKVAQGRGPPGVWCSNTCAPDMRFDASARAPGDPSSPGRTGCRRCCRSCSGPGISHRKLSKMNFMGMGPWMMGTLAKQYGVAKPKELLEAAQALGVEFMPCQMTMDMFGLTKADMIDGLGEPVGAATVIELLSQRRRAAVHLTNQPTKEPHHDRRPRRPTAQSPAPSTPAAASAPGR